MNQEMRSRILEEATHMKDTKKTIREVAHHYQVSKSTVHKDLKERLRFVDQTLEKEIKEILQNHKEVRHLRGGESTKRKFLAMKDQK